MPSINDSTPTSPAVEGSPEQRTRVPVAPGMAPVLATSPTDKLTKDATHRIVNVSLAAIAIAIAAAGTAGALLALISLITNISFFGRVAISDTTPVGSHLGVFVIIVPVIGG